MSFAIRADDGGPGWPCWGRMACILSFSGWTRGTRLDPADGTFRITVEARMAYCSIRSATCTIASSAEKF